MVVVVRSQPPPNPRFRDVLAKSRYERELSVSVRSRFPSLYSINFILLNFLSVSSQVVAAMWSRELTAAHSYLYGTYLHLV